MNSLQITNQNMNYTSKNHNTSVVFQKRSKSPKNCGQQYNYGEKVREKNNYTLYVSGQGYERPQYEERQKGIKIIKNRYDDLKYNLNQKNKIIKICNEEVEEENDFILTSDNYRYKETKNIKKGNPNLKIVTIHKSSPRKQIIYSPKRNKNIKIRDENCYWNGEYGEQIRVLRENKSSDYLQPLKRRRLYQNNFEIEKDGELIQEIIEPDDNNNYNNKIINEDPHSHIETKKDGDYFIKVTTTRKEVDPYNNQNYIYHRDKGGKIIKIIKNNQENCSIYHRKNLKRDNSENEPYYIGNYGEEEDNYDSQDQYNANNNYRFQEGEKYEYKVNNGCRNQIYKNGREYNGDDCNINDEQEEEDIRDIKDIQCPLHGKISIIIYKHPFGYN